MEVGDEHDVALDIDVGGEEKAVLLFEEVAFEVEPLEALVGAVTDGDFWGAIAVVEPLSVWGVKLSVLFSGAAKGADVLPVFVVAVDVSAAVAVAEVAIAVG